MSTNDVLNQHVFTYNTLDLRGSETISGSALPAIPSLPEETVDYEYNAVNQLLSATNPNLTFVYDDDGNMTQGYTPDGYVFTATYDAENRMTSLEYTDSGSIVHRREYHYSGDDFLAVIRKFENSSLVDEIRIVRDGFLAVQDRDENNAVVREYTWGLNLGGGIGGLLNLKQGGQDYAYLYDGKGNVAAILDSSQAVVAAYRYAPFGKLLAKTGSLEQPFGFSTKRYDPQAGLIYYGYRFYAPAIGRWTTRDPLGEAGGMNLYAFVGNNPVNWVDPWGLKIRAPIDIEGMIRRNQEYKSALDFLPDLLLDMLYPTTPEEIASALGSEVMGMVCPLNISGGTGSKVTLSEAKRLMKQWDKGTFRTLSESIRHHAAKHGYGDDVWKYLRKAANFNTKGARRIYRVLDNSTLYKKGKEFIIKRGGKIISYGENL